MGKDNNLAALNPSNPGKLKKQRIDKIKKWALKPILI